jgi:hypothetical protein
MPDLDEDILRQLMLRSTDDLFAPPTAAAAAIKRQRRRHMRTRVLGAAGTVAVAGLAAGVLASASGKGAPGGVGPRQGRATGSAAPPMRLTAAQQALFSLSAAAAAAKTPRPGGRYVVLKEQTSTIESGAGVKVSYMGGKTSVIDTVTGGGVTYQDIAVSGAAGTPAPPAVLNAAPGNSPTIAQLDAMPTDPAKLRAALLSQAEQQLKQAQQLMKQQLKKLGAEGKKMIADQPQETRGDLVFQQAANLLWQPDLSPALRSALYKVLAATPGVTVQTGVTDSSHRPATEISRFDAAANQNVETFEDPATGATLESAWDNPSGEFDEDLYQSITYTNTIPPDPYKG